MKNDRIPKEKALYNIPSEIYCLIFIFARQASLVLDPHTLNRRPTELTISHVCQLWRTISISYPLLWNIFRYSMPKGRTIWPTDRLNAYLQRSQSSLLEIWLNFRGDDGTRDFWRRSHEAMLTTLFMEVDRWRRFTVLLDPHDPLLSLFKYFANPKVYPIHLEHFALCYESSKTGHSSAEKASPKIFLSGAPNLASVRLDCSTYKDFLPPLYNIVTLRLEGKMIFSHLQTVLYLSSIIHLLKIPSLENISLSGFQLDSFEDSEDAPRISMQKIKDFRCASKGMAMLLTKIDAPYLHTITLKNVPFPILQSDAVPSLEGLILLNCQVPWGDFSDRLSPIAKQIARLTISDDSTGNFYLHALSEMSAENWPVLRSVRFNIQQVSHIEMYLQLALMNGNYPSTLCVHQNLVDMWTERNPAALFQLENTCRLETWDETTPLVPRQWPYAEETCVDHVYDKMDHDQFRAVSYQ